MTFSVDGTVRYSGVNIVKKEKEQGWSGGKGDGREEPAVKFWRAGQEERLQGLLAKPDQKKCW